MVRTVVYDDNQSRRESLKALIELSDGLEWAGSFASCDTVLADMEAAKPDLVLMDIQMPGTDGMEGLLQIKAHYPHIKVLMQTAFDNDEKVFRALQLGAEGYILKTSTAAQIAQSIDEVMKGGAAMTPSIALKVMRFFSSHQPGPNQYNLSPKETQVLDLLAKGNSYKMVADALGISYFTVNSHVKKVYEKLQVHSLSEALALYHKQKLG